MNKNITRTICIKLDLATHDPVLTATMKAFNSAAAWIARVCWDEGITNTNTAHHRVYGETRERFGLAAQLAVNARAKAVEAVKSVKAKKRETCPVFGPRGSVRMDNHHSYSFKPLDHVSLLTMEGRITCRMILGARQHAMLTDPAWESGTADLVWRRGVYYLHVTQSRVAPDVDDTGGVIGVDLGIVNVAVDSDGQIFTGEQVRKVRARYKRQREELQKVGTKSAKRKAKRKSGTEARFQSDVNHCISKTLVAKAVASCKALALEDLTGIRERLTVRHEQRYERHSWAFYQLRTYIAYKSAHAGVRVTLVDPRNTSRTCPECGHCAKANRRTQSEFLCQQCGYTALADFVGARNIQTVAVNQPMVAAPVSVCRKS
ncbi:MAG: IS200/IS605 family element transposase accessory protein TnpB [Ktedonobacterales bacterium]|nr:IS200/IS605 family element transposase accessory protein TnpB [Ktedonobacterales bacterium]